MALTPPTLAQLRKNLEKNINKPPKCSYTQIDTKQVFLLLSFGDTGQEKAGGEPVRGMRYLPSVL